MTDIKQDKKWGCQFPKKQPSNLMVNIRSTGQDERQKETLCGIAEELVNFKVEFTQRARLVDVSCIEKD